MFSEKFAYNKNQQKITIGSIYIFCVAPKSIFGAGRYLESSEVSDRLLVPNF